MPAVAQSISVTSPATSTAANSGTVDVKHFDSIRIVAILQGATGDTLDIYLQASWDNGTTWFDFVHFPQLAAAAAQTTKTITLSRANANTTLTAIGSGTSPALAAGTYLDGEFGSLIRARFVPGASTSAGAAQTIHILGTDARHR
jgi:hypothetical protein